MKKVVVIGCPGSGKSTFSRALQPKRGKAPLWLRFIYCARGGEVDSLKIYIVTQGIVMLE